MHNSRILRKDKIIKNKIKKLFQLFKIAHLLTDAHYQLTALIPNSTHPKRRMVRFYSQFIKKNDLCFDVGANEGNRSSLFLELGAKVVSVEPQRLYIKKLKEYFKNKKNITIVPKAVGESEGFKELSICEDLPAISTLSKRWEEESIHAKKYNYKWTRKEKVPITTLDNLISQYGTPLFCKIDVEGFEKQVLNGLTRPIKALSFEFNSGFFDETKECINRISEIAQYKFNYVAGEPSGDGLVLKEWVDRDTLIREIELKYNKVKDLWGDIYAKIFIVV